MQEVVVSSDAFFTEGAAPGSPAQSTQDEDAYVLEVWGINRLAVDIFTRCQPGLIAGMTGVVWTGVSATEIESVCNMKRVPPELWGDVIDDVQTMAGAAADYKSSIKPAASPPRGRR